MVGGTSLEKCVRRVLKSLFGFHTEIKFSGKHGKYKIDETIFLAIILGKNNINYTLNVFTTLNVGYR
jgi:hypothetical protein